ncbi:MAG: hypothetical protein AAFV93_03880 [Chloroflexota bacterium]
MEQQQLLHALQLPPTSQIYLTEMLWRGWGRDVEFRCIVNHYRFGLHFLDCRETRWQLYSHMQHPDNPPFPQTELANFKIGRDQHRSPAHLLTEHFGLSVVYGGLELHHEEQITLPGR